MEQSLIFPTRPECEFDTPERCHITEILNKGDLASFSIARARVEPGVQTQLHALRHTDEAYYILSGEGEMEVDGQIIGAVRSGDVIWIAKGKSQRIRNTGAGDLLFLCICHPRFEAEAYEDLEGA